MSTTTARHDPTDKPGRRKAAAIALATALAIPAEGLRQIAYYCPAGILSTCYGSTGAHVKKNVFYPLDECKRLLNKEMAVAIDTVEKCVPGLPAPVLAAFADSVYNAGPTIACNRAKSTAARYLHQGKLIEACNQLPRWNKARVMGVMIPLPGLTTRRNNERELCLTGVA